MPHRLLPKWLRKWPRISVRGLIVALRGDNRGAFGALRNDRLWFLFFSSTLGLKALYGLDMPRRLRIEFEGPIYLGVARRNARQKILRGYADRRRLTEGLDQVGHQAGQALLWRLQLRDHCHNQAAQALLWRLQLRDHCHKPPCEPHFQ